LFIFADGYSAPKWPARHVLQRIARSNDGGMPNMRLKVRLM